MRRERPLTPTLPNWRYRPKTDVLDVVGERRKTAATRTFGLGRYTVAEGQRKLLEQAGDEGGPQITSRGTRQRIRSIALVSLGRARRVLGGLLGDGDVLGAVAREGQSDR